MKRKGELKREEADLKTKQYYIMLLVSARL